MGREIGPGGNGSRNRSPPHKTDIAEPIALYVKDDEKFPHVVLLLPGGRGLEAVGSYDGSRARGLRILPLTLIQIQKALEEMLIEQKLRKHAK